uniref:DNA 5'-3' helicase n=1 Tax=Vertebrata thuyoides TaxID=2006970 RepID=A0A1Z1MB34_9FLOR|nr:Replication helicase subunit [Vertebrata thuyoides]ARW63196.1 Replication helicase subunit [Vertebrata thuyoides]
MQNFYRYKFIPHNYLAEETLIGIILIYPQITYKILYLVEENIFFIETNKILYLHLLKILQSNRISIISLFYELKSRNLLKKVGGATKLTNLMKQSQVFISSYKTNYYVEDLILLLNKNYFKRLIIQLGYNIIKMGHISNITNEHVYKKILSYFKNVEEKSINKKVNKVCNIKEIISEKLLQIKYKKIDFEEINTTKKIKSGFIELDKIVKGFINGNLVIIAGRPAVGKTSFTINIAYYCFYTEKINLLIFSLEMSINQIFNKFILIDSGNTIEKQSIKTFKNNHWKRISQICHQLLKQNIYINEEINLSIDQIENISINIKKQEYIELIIIDYLQLIEIPLENSKIQNRSQELGYITRRLKLLAQSLKIPIIVISQLNRNIESRNDKEPILSDLKESGCIFYKNNILISSKYLTKISISNITKYHKVLNKKRKKYTIQSLNKKISKIQILNKYVFLCTIGKQFIGLTFNHKFLSKKCWIPSHQLVKTTLIFHKHIKNHQINLNIYLNNMMFHKYEKIYDIYIKNYFNLIIQETYIHNSIEQDADIIIILYEINNNKVTTNDKDKTIDLKISKNRNGKTGYCTLKFKLNTGTFENISIS